LQAQLIRKQLRRDFDAVLPSSVLSQPDARGKEDGVDFLVYPSAISAAPALGQTTDKLSEYAQDVLNVPASLAGCPACSIPFGRDADGWPLGVQIASTWGFDQQVLHLAHLLLSK
jgi:aspartyl-tRNA(Asn)/glutamyl-tRNA(Gln) amidotransferase subunit A